MMFDVCAVCQVREAERLAASEREGREAAEELLVQKMQELRAQQVCTYRVVNGSTTASSMWGIALRGTAEPSRCCRRRSLGRW